jgi:hypothetical protein
MERPQMPDVPGRAHTARLGPFSLGGLDCDIINAVVPIEVGYPLCLRECLEVAAPIQLTTLDNLFVLVSGEIPRSDPRMKWTPKVGQVGKLRTERDAHHVTRGEKIQR